MDPPCGLTDGLGKEGAIIARASANDGPRPEVRAGVADGGELGPKPLGKRFLAAPADVVTADVANLESRGVDGGLGPLVDQAERASASEDGVQELFKSPFLSRRCSA